MLLVLQRFVGNDNLDATRINNVDETGFTKVRKKTVTIPLQNAMSD
jgi:hypothetical protein